MAPMPMSTLCIYSRVLGRYSLLVGSSVPHGVRGARRDDLIACTVLSRPEFARQAEADWVRMLVQVMIKDDAM